MKVLLFAFGTRGDVQPFVALARGLRAHGHEPVLAAPQRFTALAAEHGVALHPVDDGPLRLVDAGEVGETVRRGVRGILATARALPGTFGPVLDDAAAIAAGAGADADLVVHNGQIIAAPHLAEALGVPAVLALAVPLSVPTREFAWPGQALPERLPGPLRRASYLGMRAPQLMFARTVDTWRRERLDLPARRHRHDPLRDPAGGPVPVLHAVSRHVVPPPADWPAHVTTTGYWFLPSAGGLPADLAAFLAAGPPPVLVGFGSMSGPDPAATTAAVLEAVDRAGVRAVLAAGWGGLRRDRPLPAHVHAVDDVPHDLLLPHVAAVVHHGGAGTTAAAAAAGRPQVVCPFVADQPFWARRMQRLGVAPAPVPQRRLTAGALAAALGTATTDTGIRERAAALGARIRGEDGVTAAVARLETLPLRARRASRPGRSTR